MSKDEEFAQLLKNNEDRQQEMVRLSQFPSNPQNQELTPCLDALIIIYNKGKIIRNLMGLGV